jgi:quercetin dioxygenase-like cupin family protein
MKRRFLSWQDGGKMIKLKPYKQMSDPRGTFLGIINSGHWEEMNYIETDAGQIRGGHYHKKIQELFFILEGEMEIQIDATDGRKLHSLTARKGHILIVQPLEVHTFKCLTHCQWINVLSKRIDDADPDFFKHDDPLRP